MTQADLAAFADPESDPQIPSPPPGAACPPTDIFDKCLTDGGAFGAHRQRGDTYFTRPILDDKPGPRMRYQGRECIMWSINDYLGLASHPRIREATLEAARDWGLSGPMGSRMMSGNTTEHYRLEEMLAGSLGKPDACLFNIGYLGNAATIQSLTGPDDVLIMDKLAHASIVDAAQLAVATPRQLRVFRHNDLDALERLLKTVNRKRRGGIMILTEGVFGMTGDSAPLAEIVALKEKYGARLFVDDAHGFGVVGPGGRGAAALQGVLDETDLYFATFSKALACSGAFTAADHAVVEWIKYNGRAAMFSRTMPMVVVRTVIQTLEIVEKEGDRRRRALRDRSSSLADGLRGLGYTVPRVASPQVPVLLPSGTVADAMTWGAFLRERGVFASPVAYPVLPRGLILFRLCPTANHSEIDVAETIEAFGAMRDDLRLSLEIDPSLVRSVYGDLR